MKLASRAVTVAKGARNRHFEWQRVRVARLVALKSAILNRESGDSESCDSNRAIPRSL